MSKTDTWDSIIIGAGGAGMSLLYAMYVQGYFLEHRVLIIEPEEKNLQDRTWCFWAMKEEAILRHWGHLCQSSWQQMYNNGQVKNLAPFSYHQIRSADFYAFIQEILNAQVSVKWIKASAERVYQDGGNLFVSADGLTYLGHYVFDSRLSEQQKSHLRGDVLVKQSFKGWRIQTLQPFWDKSTIHLMNFDIPQENACQFVYVLPESERTALVEITRLGKELLSEGHAKSLMDEWLRAHDCGPYQILEEEKGVIPMDVELHQLFESVSPGRHIPIGTAGAAVKCSTGYAFKHMFSRSFELADAVLRKQNITTLTLNQRFLFYDSLLIDILREEPVQGQQIFPTLFDKNEAGRVLSFMEEKTKLTQEVPLLLSLPFTPFLQALGRVTVRNIFHEKNMGNSLSPEPSHISAELPVMLTLIALVLQFFAPSLLMEWAPYALLVGMIFPGIPHGALDHYLDMKATKSRMHMLGFIVSYLSMMLAIGVLWWFVPVVGLISFLLYSAWHFGETDLREWGVFSKSMAFLYGLAILTFLLSSHMAETLWYFDAMGVTVMGDFSANLTLVLIVTSVLFMLWPGVYLRGSARKSWLSTCFVLLAGAFLPLIPAFGLYFIGLHSFRGWFHLKRGLRLGHRELFKKSLPFSMGAYGMFIVLLVLLAYYEYPIWNLMPLLFIFLAAISAPHIFLMSQFYRVRFFGGL